MRLQNFNSDGGSVGGILKDFSSSALSSFDNIFKDYSWYFFLFSLLGLVTPSINNFLKKKDLFQEFFKNVLNILYLNRTCLRMIFNLLTVTPELLSTSTSTGIFSARTYPLRSVLTFTVNGGDTQQQKPKFLTISNASGFYL